MAEMGGRFRAVVAQRGSREHFLAARALHGRSALAALVVDWYPPSSQFIQRAGALLLGSRGRAALSPASPDLPRRLVRPLRMLGLWHKWRERSAARGGARYEGFDRADAAFAWAVARLRLPPHEVFFGYSYASLEALEAERRRGVFTILDQIDPGPVEHRLVDDEMRRHPDVAGLPPAFPFNHYGRARREWELADVIIVNSEWSRDAIVAEGADSRKIEVLPLAYQIPSPRSQVPSRERAGRNLRVLWLGQVNVRKGIQYLLEAARLLAREPVEFVVAGPVGIRNEQVNAAPQNIKWLGPVPRGETAALFGESDVFVLPTLSDGFAITQLEALAHGVPVIVTPNCARVVEDGVTGFVIPPRDAAALAAAVLKFARDPGLARRMSGACVKSAGGYSVEAYANRLAAIIEDRRRPGRVNIHGTFRPRDSAFCPPVAEART